MRRNIRVWDSVRHAQAIGLARRIQCAAKLRPRHRAKTKSSRDAICLVRGPAGVFKNKAWRVLNRGFGRVGEILGGREGVLDGRGEALGAYGAVLRGVIRQFGGVLGQIERQNEAKFALKFGKSWILC